MPNHWHTSSLIGAASIMLLAGCSSTATSNGQEISKPPTDATSTTSGPINRATAQAAGRNAASPAIAALAGRSDAILIGTLLSIDNRAVAPDGQRSTLEFSVDEALKGALGKGAKIRLRFLAGYNPDGTLAQITDSIEVISGRQDAVRPGERFLIFTSRSAYEQRVAASGGKPISGVTQALDILRIRGDEAQGFGMNPLFIRLPELRATLESADEKK